MVTEFGQVGVDSLHGMAGIEWYGMCGGRLVTLYIYIYIYMSVGICICIATVQAHMYDYVWGGIVCISYTTRVLIPNMYNTRNV